MPTPLSLMRNLGRSIAAILTMSLGIGAATAIFSLIRPVLLHPFTFPNAAELVMIDEPDPQGAFTPVSYPDLRDWSSQRTAISEIGASNADVTGLVLRESLHPVAAGLALGLLMSLALRQLVAELLYQVAPADPWVLATVAIATASAALLSCGVPLLRALRIDPAIALRMD